ncbi:hypothetical protein APUTEX25_002515 [Auxenochlorella protothecoides]|uniref:Uncharacterized protein n=1 Tax=Auxenochlorella protothecoides TaxID=3075 RepID=A0A3M7KVF8_AUXPR|nr:hypothetical protein APUTEX25_002515 [Auxenochlorella protothecoides]|eukprot:RMZ53106.1 hypothetical protein APUTEX25_002515 [Auxenochlorella protothecoides]
MQVAGARKEARAPANVASQPEPSPASIAGSLLGKGYQNLEADYELGKVLGRGQFGTTRLARHRATSQSLACKSIAKRKLTSAEDVADVQRERPLPILPTFCSEADAAALLRTIIVVVAYCHSLNVMHRDLKPENFLLASPAEDAAIKCTDFGLSVFFKAGERFTDVVGSAYYIAPEVVLHHNYGPEADIWSCGVILYILLSGMPPFYGDTEKEIFRCVLKGTIDFDTEPWPGISPEAKDCVARMLDPNPKTRARANELLRHPWLRENGVASDKRLDDVIITRLGTFATHNKLKREAMRVIATGMPAEEIAGLKALFEAIDRDRSGTITAEELREALKMKGAVLRAADLETLMSLIDVDASGTIEYEEFLAATMSRHQLEKEENMLRAFHHFDADGSGTISREELIAALSKGGLLSATEKEVDAILKEVDVDGSGTIDYAEFCGMMTRNQESALKVADASRSTRGNISAYKASKTAV